MSSNKTNFPKKRIIKMKIISGLIFHYALKSNQLQPYNVAVIAHCSPTALTSILGT